MVKSSKAEEGWSLMWLDLSLNSITAGIKPEKEQKSPSEGTKDPLDLSSSGNAEENAAPNRPDEIVRHLGTKDKLRPMDVVKFDGTPQDLDRFSSSVLQDCGAVDVPSSIERRVSWDVEGYVGSVSVSALRSGMLMTASDYSGEKSFDMLIDHAAAGIEFSISRGQGAAVLLLDENDEELEALQFGGGTYQIGQIKRPVRLACHAGEGAREESVRLNIDPQRLQELLGSETLPDVVQRVVSSPRPFELVDAQMTPQLYKVLDEVLYCDARGLSRQLYLEAKSLELLALLVDHLEEGERQSSLSQPDVERLHRARQLLMEQMSAPPSLPELARQAGLNEAKLKAGFKEVFGASVFGYLRGQRMEEAARLLRARRLNVTEVARRVGYANPSKFAAAFRKQYGMSPSALS